MRSPFGWDLPPGVTTSMLPGNSAAEQAAEEAAEALYAGLYAATRAGFSVAEIMEGWRIAAEEAYADEEAAYLAQMDES